MEQTMLKARTAPFLKNLTVQEFKMSMVKPITISGIKQLPSQEEFTILSQLIVEKYGNITLGEMQLAFDLNALGTEWTRIEHYNMFSVQYVSDVLTRYIEYSRKAIQDISKKEERKQMLVEERVNIQALYDMLVADKQDEYFEKKIRYTAPLIMQSLIKRGYFKDEYISDELFNEIKIKVKSKMYQIMGDWDRAKYSSEEWKSMIKTEQINQVKCEVYKHIISTDSIYSQIIENIKADL
jgi:hypothetical protein